MTVSYPPALELYLHPRKPVFLTMTSSAVEEECFWHDNMVGWVGIEPTAKGLKGLCSTTELPTRYRYCTQFTAK